jgi:hypothetical protein
VQAQIELTPQPVPNEYVEQQRKDEERDRQDGAEPEDEPRPQ